MQHLCTALSHPSIERKDFFSYSIVQISKQGTVSLARAVQSKLISSVAIHLVNWATCVR